MTSDLFTPTIVSIEIMRILNINEVKTNNLIFKASSKVHWSAQLVTSTPIFLQVDGIFETQQKIEMEWRDPRVKFHNLLPLQFQNSLSEAEKDDLWIPTLTFSNTAKQERSQRDNNSVVEVARQGRFVRSTHSEGNNIYLYTGEGNPLHVSRVYSTKWLCNFDMTWYPFDTQVG